MTASAQSINERADALELAQMKELDERIVAKSMLHCLAEGKDSLGAPLNPNVEVDLNRFEDVIGRNFRQPGEGLGNDNTPASHLWRTLRRPSNAL